MSLDVYLTCPLTQRRTCESCGQRRTCESCGLQHEHEMLFQANITHNLGKMAAAADLYYPLWQPKEQNLTTATQLVPLLRDGLARLRAEPEHFRQFNASNGWGVYENLVAFVADYLVACERFPNALVHASR